MPHARAPGLRTQRLAQWAAQWAAQCGVRLPTTPHTQARYAHPAAPATTVPTHALVSTAARPVAPRHGRHNAPRSSRNDMLTACTPVHLATDAAQCPHRRDLSGFLAPHTGCAHTYACRPRTGAESITQATAAHAKQASIQVRPAGEGKKRVLNSRVKFIRIKNPTLIAVVVVVGVHRVSPLPAQLA